MKDYLFQSHQQHDNLQLNDLRIHIKVYYTEEIEMYWSYGPKEVRL